MRLLKLIEGLKDKEILYLGDNPEREILSLSTDSKEIGKEGLFFCLTGGKSDGHIFAQEAVKNGATAIVAERKLDLDVPQILVPDSRSALSLLSAAFYGNPSQNMKIVGVTGTNGKTTTTYMLSAIFNAVGKKTGVIGTLGVNYNGKTYPCDLTTPDPIPLQKTLAKMRSNGVEYVFMEVSAHALWYKKTHGISFAVCIFTNLSQDHLDFFSNMEEYKNTKKMLFVENCQIAVLNGDDAVGREIADGLNTEKVWRYTLNSDLESAATVFEKECCGNEFSLHINGKTLNVALPMVGRHNVYNALAAATCATALGIDGEIIRKALSDFQGVEGRLERVGKYNGCEIFVDFAHTPDGISKALESLKTYSKRKTVCVFGCGGNRDKSKRPIMGERVAKLADFSVLTSDNPRFEDPLDIISDIEKGYRAHSLRYVVVPNREKAIAYALDLVKAGDVLLVAGKGGEKYQEIMGIKYPFEDKAIINKLISERNRFTPKK